MRSDEHLLGGSDYPKTLSASFAYCCETFFVFLIKFSLLYILLQLVFAVCWRVREHGTQPLLGM